MVFGFRQLVHKTFPGIDGGLLSVFADMIEGILAMGGKGNSRNKL